MAHIAIVYWTKSGHTGRAADDIKRTLIELGHDVELIELPEPNIKLDSYDAVIVGSPCHAGSIPGVGTGAAPSVNRFLDRVVYDTALNGKITGAYAVHCKMGGERTIGEIEQKLQEAGAQAVVTGPAITAGVPFSFWTGKMASAQDRDKLREFAQKIAGVLKPNTD